MCSLCPANLPGFFMVGRLLFGECGSRESLRIGVLLDARLISANDFHVGTNDPGLGAHHVHLLARITGDVEDRRIPGALGTRCVDPVCRRVTRRRDDMPTRLRWKGTNPG